VLDERTRVAGLRDDGGTIARWWPRPRTVAECMAGAHDNFNVLRLLAASLVIYGHSWAIANSNGENDWVSRHLLLFSGTIAVNMFFFVSGFLVTGSCVRRGSLWTFAQARLLRVYPALVGCGALCAFVLGSAVTTEPLRAYLGNAGPYLFFAANSSLIGSYHAPHLPGVFEANRFPQVVIGSLWTLPGEMQMYGYVAAMGALGLFLRRTRFVIAMTTLVLVAVFARDSVPLLSRPEYYGFAAFFVAGASCWMFREYVPVSGYLLAALIALCWMAYPGALYLGALAATTAYLCLWFVYVPGLKSLEPPGDYSYGLYLYGFPMQQLVAWKFPTIGPWLLLAASFPLALTLAVASWHWLEKPALALKEQQPRSPSAALDRK
jgi:peptidoglycan/LPS O-acetylase OafA/YrhL